jgi:hypothetical protein
MPHACVMLLRAPLLQHLLFNKAWKCEQPDSSGLEAGKAFEPHTRFINADECVCVWAGKAVQAGDGRREIRVMHDVRLQ